MWEESLIDSTGRRSGKRWYAFPVSAAIHVAVLSLLVVSSYWYIEKIDGLPLREPIRVFKGEPPPAYGDKDPQMAQYRQQEVETVHISTRRDQSAQIVPAADIKLQEVIDPESPVDLAEFGPGTGRGRRDGVPGADPNSSGRSDSIGTQKEADDPPLFMTTEVDQPVLLQRVDPEYPLTAIRLRLEGYVLLQAVITRTGTVDELKILRSDHAIFNNAAIDAVRKWKYRPATINGRPVKVYFTVTVRFELR